jgi:hypothetical protein
MSTESQNGSKVTPIRSTQEFLDELDRVELAVRTERDRLQERLEQSDMEARERNAHLPQVAVEAEPSKPVRFRKTKATIVGVLIGTCLTGIGYEIYQGIDNGSYTQVGSINCDIEICEG